MTRNRLFPVEIRATASSPASKTVYRGNPKTLYMSIFCTTFTIQYDARGAFIVVGEKLASGQSFVGAPRVPRIVKDDKTNAILQSWIDMEAK